MDHRPSMLDLFHHRVVSTPALQVFTSVNRGLLAAAFVPSGLAKILGHRFTTLPTTTPVGSFFEAFFQAHAYYAFIGWAQITAALLLLVPATTTIGAIVYFPIILNIFVITVAVGFQGTPIVTGMMLLANLYLLAWDYDRIKGLLVPDATREPRPSGATVVRAGFGTAIALSSGGGALAALAVFGQRSVMGAAGLAVASLVVGITLLVVYRRNLRDLGQATS